VASRTASIATVYTVLNKVFDVLPEILPCLFGG
jgi:hypothetical protein